MSTATDVANSIYDFDIQRASGESESMTAYRDKVLLIVNTASACGFTKQYAGLESLYEALAPQGLEILAFPCNQFGGQEPGSDEEIQSFCTTKFNTTFPVFKKIEVNGGDTHPLYRFLKKQAKGVLGTEAIKWNFTKFLVDRNGDVVDRFAPKDEPEALRPKIEALL